MTANPALVSSVDRHIHLLALLYRAAAFISVVAGASLAALGVGALSMGGGPGLADPAWAARAMAVVFLLLSLALLAWAWLNAWLARAFERRHRRARVGGFVVAVLHLFVLPFGTALGGYTIWVLIGEGARRAFELNEAGGPSSREA